MRASDIVIQLINKLPQLSEEFTDELTVLSVIRAGTTLTVTTDGPHKLVLNSAVSLAGALTPINLTSLTRSGTVGTLVTEDVHDITEPINSNPNTRTDVVLSGSVEAEFNGTFTILTVPNRKTITFTMDDSGPVIATGSPIIENGSSALQTLSKLYQVATVPSTTTFTVEDPNTGLPDPVGSITARKNCRVSRGVNPERLIEAYTEKSLGNIKNGTPITKLWAFVVLGGPVASKDRTLSNDATSNLSAGNEYRQQVSFNFSIFLFIPTARGEVAAGAARDKAADLLTIMCQCVLGHQFATGTAVERQGAVNYISDDGFAYNTAFYVHEYIFSQVSDLIFEDTTGPAVDVAFRDLDFDIFTTTQIDEPPSIDGTDNTIDLDDVDL